MKKEAVLFALFISVIFIAPFLTADEQSQVDKAYTCLENRINQTNCSLLSYEERVFSLLADGKCQNEVMAENLSSQCWPKSSCRVKSTAQAVLALKSRGTNTTAAENWLLSQTSTPNNLDWFLEIESSESTSCIISYSGLSYTISIGSNKKIASGAGNCLSLDSSGYWLKFSPSCYNQNVDISCDKNFITTLLFKKQDSSTVHVSEIVHSASAKGKTREKVDSLCFAQAGVCNYEGSLWAAQVLYSLSYDVSKFMPYIVTMMDENEVYLPESFLYYLTGKFRTDLLIKQKASSYWEESGDKYYDTALALWPFYYESSFEKANSKEWLLDVQGTNGCWDNGNIRNTAFILYSIWPKSGLPPITSCSVNSDCPIVSCKTASCDSGVCFYSYNSCSNNDGCCPPGCTALGDNDCSQGPECNVNSDCNIYVSESNKYCSNNSVFKDFSNWYCGNNECKENKTAELIETCSVGEQCLSGNCLTGGTTGDDFDCESSGYFCMSYASCDGNILSSYTCSGIFKCCDVESLNTCSNEGGDICNSDETCIGGTNVDVSDTQFGQTCCVSGTCQSGGTVITGCENNNGVCRSTCNSGEKEDSFYDCSYGDVCCMSSGDDEKSSTLWIWILLGLILISVIGIVFRDKLRALFLRLKLKSNKPKRPEMPLMHHTQTPHQRIMPRGILPPAHAKHPIRRPIPVKKKIEEKPSELDEVLKKLKEMGK